MSDAKIYHVFAGKFEFVGRVKGPIGVQALMLKKPVSVSYTPNPAGGKNRTMTPIVENDPDYVGDSLYIYTGAGVILTPVKEDGELYAQYISATSVIIVPEI